jgi:hypothetical protein
LNLTRILSCDEAIQLAYRNSVVLLRCPLWSENNAWRGTLGLPLPVKLGSGHMIFTVLAAKTINIPIISLLGTEFCINDVGLEYFGYTHKRTQLMNILPPM